MRRIKTTQSIFLFYERKNIFDIVYLLAITRSLHYYFCSSRITTVHWKLKPAAHGAHDSFPARIFTNISHSRIRRSMYVVSPTSQHKIILFSIGFLKFLLLYMIFIDFINNIDTVTHNKCLETLVSFI